MKRPNPQPSQDKVFIGYVHPNTVTEGFCRSLAENALWQANGIMGFISASNPRQEVARNAAIKSFLDTPGDWFMWIDTDMTFEYNSIERLVATAHKHKADIVSGLGFIYKRQDEQIVPNGYWFDEEDLYYKEHADYEPGKVYEIDGTGSGFVLIHRRVLEAWDDEFWHSTWRAHPHTGGQMGHDLAFCFKAKREYGFKIVWDTGVKTGHIKHFELTEENYNSYRESL